VATAEFWTDDGAKSTKEDEECEKRKKSEMTTDDGL
jgi:hypothetical protein